MNIQIFGTKGVSCNVSLTAFHEFGGIIDWTGEIEK